MCGVANDIVDAINPGKWFGDAPEAPDYSGVVKAQEDAAARQAEALAAIAEQQAALLEANSALVQQQQDALNEEQAKADAEQAITDQKNKRRRRLAASGPETLLTGGRGVTGTPSLLQPSLGGMA